LFWLLRRGQVERASEPSRQEAAFVEEASPGLFRVPVNQAREVVVGLQGKKFGKLIFDTLLSLYRGLKISFANLWRLVRGSSYREPAQRRGGLPASDNGH
jgi:hypothetical protein